MFSQHGSLVQTIATIIVHMPTAGWQLAYGGLPSRPRNGVLCRGLRRLLVRACTCASGSASGVALEEAWRAASDCRNSRRQGRTCALTPSPHQPAIPKRASCAPWLPHCRATTYRTGNYSSAIVLRESATGKVLLCARSGLGGTWNVCASNNEAIVTVAATRRRKYGAGGTLRHRPHTGVSFRWKPRLRLSPGRLPCLCHLDHLPALCDTHPSLPALQARRASS